MEASLICETSMAVIVPSNLITGEQTGGTTRTGIRRNF
jgi:hypothetical protein